MPGFEFGTIPQLLPPGWRESEKTFAGNYEIFWSLYIRCNNMRKLRKIHIPALEALIGQPHGGKGWVFEDEDHNEDRDRSLQRIVAVQRLNGSYNNQFLLDFMQTLYSLSPSWTIQARLDPAHPKGVYVNARFARETAPEAPAVVDAMVELEGSFTGAIVGESGRYLGTGQRIGGDPEADGS
ncbi:hypothetical protein [Mesorhizobium sp. ES1-4]|uniref:hypothetical protein n=1 Tax=Mesorhizobium sp. ES1-4 TaxID=2876627 RepID=UPI001CCCB40F|nr:hypothetical protein [Mesorhizobium sp. ES1-4]MBZ9794700.1 hypothetical protein [Mesorhizobium sp. ES1-4]